MKCAACRPLLSKYVDGEATPAEVRLVEAHIGGCEACTQALIEFRLVQTHFAGLPTRQPDPPELPPQFDLLREVLDALGQPQAEAEGWEADDAIGAICARAKASAGDRIDVVTGDRDLIQLVRDPVVRVLFTVRGVSQIAEYDEAGVLAKYGIPASRYPDFAILRGDPSDGLPGVPGIGEKTARAIVLAYPSLDELLADAERRNLRRGPPNRSPRLVATLRASADYVRTMQQIVPVRADVEVTQWRREPDPVRVDELATTRRLAGPLARFRAALGET